MAEQYLKRDESRVTNRLAARVGSGKAADEGGWSEPESQMSKGVEEEQFVGRKTRTSSSEETGWLDQSDGGKEGPLIGGQRIQAEEPADGVGASKSQPGLAGGILSIRRIRRVLASTQICPRKKCLSFRFGMIPKTYSGTTPLTTNLVWEASLALR
jgi:hypothetical protein